MKKIISVFLVFVYIVSGVSFCVSAQPKDEKIVIELRSDIAGMTIDDYRDFAVIRSDNIVFDETQRSDPVYVADCTGNMYFEKMKPGRVYRIGYTLYAADGFEIPVEFDENNIEFICSDNVDVYWYGKTIGTGKDGGCLASLSVWTEVKVDGNFFQNIFGAIADWLLKIKSWSPY